MFDCVQRKGKSENKSCDNLESTRTGLWKNKAPRVYVYQGTRYTVYDLIRINYTCDNDTQPLSVLDL